MESKKVRVYRHPYATCNHWILYCPICNGSYHYPNWETAMTLARKIAKHGKCGGMAW